MNQRTTLRDVLARGRRLLAFLVPILVFAALVVVGRHLAPPVAADAAWAAAPDAPAASSPSTASEAGAAPADASSTLSALSTAGDASIDAPHPALELLEDGAVLVDLNAAGEEELERLPGIGPTRAKAILALRGKLGRFKSVDDLARIKGIGRAMLRRLRPRVRIGGG